MRINCFWHGVGTTEETDLRSNSMMDGPVRTDVRSNSMMEGHVGTDLRSNSVIDGGNGLFSHQRESGMGQYWNLEHTGSSTIFIRILF